MQEIAARKMEVIDQQQLMQSNVPQFTHVTLRKLLTVN